MKQDKKIYLLSFDLQRDEISTYCFDMCGSISVGAISLELEEGLPEMHFMPCSRTDCPHLDRQMDEPSAVDKNTLFFLRKLKPLSTLVRTQAAVAARAAQVKNN